MTIPPCPTDWRAWRARYAASYVRASDAPRHERVWAWFAALARDVRPRPLVEIWPRGGAKSTTIELATAHVGHKGARRFALYVSETQAQADKHLQAIGAVLERIGIPRATTSYNTSKGWTQQMLRAANGFNVVSFGLDAASRGVKLEEYRPDLIIFDDVDGKHDTPETKRKKLETITETIIPSGSADAAIVFVQNLVYDGSIASDLATGRADWLLDRLPVVVEPAAHGLAYEQRPQPDGGYRYVVTAGEPTWAGQDLATIERQINDWGRRAFEREAQQNVRRTGGGLWDYERDIAPHRVAQAPPLVRVVVAVDPSNTAAGDEAGILAGGVDARGHAYVCLDASLQGSPGAWALEAVKTYHLLKADALVAEDNNGGEMVEVTIGTVPNAPRVKRIHASRGKLTRAEPVQRLYEDGRVHHVGVFDALEDEQTTWRPGMPSPNRLDALVWLVTELCLGAEGWQPQDMSAFNRQQVTR